MSIDNMIATIQIYIHCRTDKEVNISPNLPNDLPKLFKAHNIASNWLNKNATIY